MIPLDRMKTLLDAYGADPTRWPEGERAAARELLAGSAEARAYAQEAKVLDTVLAQAALHAEVRVDAAALASRIARTPQRREAAVGSRARGSGAGAWFAFGWPNLAALAAAGVVGFLVGWSNLDSGAATNRDLIDLMAPVTVIEEPLW